ncbi:transcriptional adapter ADA2a isoform X2 [Herrania umbratica]|uniref:Transcriptional adapter n=1 Tax=Herrania umbratica TaxID=108875 RepID=A0A6J1B3H5_9ROSI|nr:transcriptional adapter ADA2a isoform X2 [Herrania umbratica]XP_021293193.1 transcriptional adapter ADA2a isoform X2 [Herrania umbratica]XP_021293194.1 transcriptional adapter ADA2a isoform X2 [Herrania umbratica]
MGRSRTVSRSTEDDLNQRSKRKRTVYGGVENLELPPSGVGHVANEAKGPALYHCNYCNKDISGMVRIKCAVCPDFDLCVECFSVGAEVTPHKGNHPYRVMDNLSFPLICPDWNADEEILLLEGIEMYGFGNWTEVAEHVGTKSKSQCIDHYNAIYMNSPCFPLPDLSHVMGKSREELLAMAKGNGQVRKEFTAHGEHTLKEESPVAAKVKYDAPRKDDPAYQSSSSLTGEVGSHIDSSSGNSFQGSGKKTNLAQSKDGIKLEEPQADRSIGEKKLRVSTDEEPSMTELSGYNFKRQEFEIEYDNDAEQLLADMEFKDTDTKPEHELKLRVLRIYSKRLDERKRRKDFILERNLLYPDPFERNLSPEEKEIYQRYKVFMRFHSKEEHEELLKSVIEEHRIVKRIQDLQEARAAGCRTAAEANKFIEQKRKKEAEENAQRLRESVQAGPSGKVLLHGSPQGVMRGSTSLQPISKEASTVIGGATTLDDWDITGFIGADLLSDTEKKLCSEIRILPSHYLSMLQTLSVELMKGNIGKKSDAHNLFKVEPSKVDRVYDMLVKKGIAQA